MIMLCICSTYFKCTLFGVRRRSMIKLSNVCPCALKFVRQKASASGN
jgi:hypothetical protein